MLRVYDRWGTLVFEGTNFPLGDTGSGWDGLFDGQILPVGVYAFYAVVAYIDGEELQFEGDVTIVR